MMKTICVECQVEYRVHSIGYDVISMAGKPPHPYSISRADIYVCPGCKNQVIDTQAHGKPTAQHEAGFSERVEDAYARRKLIEVFEGINHKSAVNDDGDKCKCGIGQDKEWADHLAHCPCSIPF